MEEASGIKFDPETIYSKTDLAAKFGVTERCIEKRIKGRVRKLPLPFHVGRVPYWKGATLIGFMNRLQREVTA